MAPSNGTTSTPPKLVVTLPNHSTLQWHPAHCTLQWHPCATSNPPKWFVALPPLLEVRTPIAIAIWGNWPTARIKYGTKTWWHCVLAVPIAAGNVQLHRVGVLLLRTSVRFFNKPRKLHRRQSYIISYKIGAHPTISHTKGCNPMGPFLPYLCAARFDPELSSWTRSRKILQKIECAPDQFSESPTVCGHALLLHGLSSMLTFWTCKHSLLVAQKLPATKPPENLVTNLVFQHIPSINFFGDHEFGSKPSSRFSWQATAKWAVAPSRSPAIACASCDVQFKLNDPTDVLRLQNLMTNTPHSLLVLQ